MLLTATFRSASRSIQGRRYVATGSAARAAAASSSSALGSEMPVKWVSCSGRVQAQLSVKPGESLLDAARRCNIELEGACDGNLACSTCHVILDRPVFDQLHEPNGQELDMLDLAADLREESRLGCQVKLDQIKHLSSPVTVRIPSLR